MSKTGSIIIIEDDADDRQLLEQAIQELEIPNKLVGFDNTDIAFDYLCDAKNKKFIIFCDINMPGRNGLEFKRQIDADPVLRKQSIPFIFLSTSARQHDVDEAYEKMSIQGFFIKPPDYKQLKEELKLVIEYWKLCRHPNN